MTTEFWDLNPNLLQLLTERKENKQRLVTDILKNDFSEAVVNHEVDFFFNHLGLEPHYFLDVEATNIANHIRALRASRLLNKSTGSRKVDIRQETKDGAIYMCTSMPGRKDSPVLEIESRIGERYLRQQEQKYRITGYRSARSIDNTANSYLRVFVVSKAEFGSPKARSKLPENDIRRLGNDRFLQDASQHTLDIYQQLLLESSESFGVPVVKLDRSEPEKRLCICYRQGTTGHFFSTLSYLYRYYGFSAVRKYGETFSNGLVIMSLFLTPKNVDDEKQIEENLDLLKMGAILVYTVPSKEVISLLEPSKKLSVHAVSYAYCAFLFVQQFINRLGTEYHSLSNVMGQLQAKIPSDDVLQNQVNRLMENLRQRLVSDRYTPDFVWASICQFPSLVASLYSHFAHTHLSQFLLEKYPALKRTLRPIADASQLTKEIQQTVADPLVREIFAMMLVFNNHVTTTNFFKEEKTSVAFRLNPAFLDDVEFPDRPYAIFFLKGVYFRGFHIRFRDIARGGIRLVTSRDQPTYLHNCHTIFEENYNLANTQQRKNKDIPEGGSKGTVLLRLDKQTEYHKKIAFQTYVDGLLDLLLAEQEQAKDIVVHNGVKSDVLFLGPDEGTADLMDWASQHARKRGYEYWKAFTTGKSSGGIPHDVYGMTTRGVRAYVAGIYRHLQLDETKVVKCQTGGPDGDLGSNEILLSKEKYKAVVDGSGVLYDPEGINRSELGRLAEARKMVREFDASLLSSKGFFVDVEDTEVKLPDGTLVYSGVAFRNGFHLSKYFTGDIFVPCGGRPKSVNITNVAELFHEVDGTRCPKFKYIVEGANLFFTQEARLLLEQEGVIIYKDASANKGGVTASSMEVLASLSLNDSSYNEKMLDTNSEFYKTYVEAVWKRIESNATAEFEVIWKEHELSGRPRSILTDELSVKINALNDQMQKSDLWKNEALRRIVLEEALPPVLLQTVSLDDIINRVPDSYLFALFAAHLASQFIYQKGLNSDEFSFFDFMQPKLCQ